MQKTVPFLWFNGDAEQAVNYYSEIFGTGLRINEILRYREGMNGPVGAVLTVDFELFGTRYIALNGGGQYKLSPAFSIMVQCADQAELDRYWNRLADGGTPLACGWITDKFGVSWQITPAMLMPLLNSPDLAQAQRVFAAMVSMVKLDIPALQRAADGR